MITIVNDSNFDAEVLRSDLPVLVDFGATWCGPCKRQVPILEEFAAQNDGRVKVCKVDIDDAPKIVADLRIRSVPTLMVFSEGKMIATKVGLTILAEITALIFTKEIK